MAIATGTEPQPEESRNPKPRRIGEAKCCGGCGASLPPLEDRGGGFCDTCQWVLSASG
ncbi:hypothetical protein [Candidatus Laterigemmans baculatus]|uniref:hypothetical protein n=1 Tax=Candidatus Laterigemmans baculatus TaxID=2770505 RepID=UPI0013D9C3F2|nr:hypothetical protein [Candidatus Laterigemmans baculatus]